MDVEDPTSVDVASAKALRARQQKLRKVVAKAQRAQRELESEVAAMKKKVSESGYPEADKFFDDSPADFVRNHSDVMASIESEPTFSVLSNSSKTAKSRKPKLKLSNTDSSNRVQKDDTTDSTKEVKEEKLDPLCATIPEGLLQEDTANHTILRSDRPCYIPLQYPTEADPAYALRLQPEPALEINQHAETGMYGGAKALLAQDSLIDVSEWVASRSAMPWYESRLSALDGFHDHETFQWRPTATLRDGSELDLFDALSKRNGSVVSLFDFLMKRQPETADKEETTPNPVQQKPKPLPKSFKDVQKAFFGDLLTPELQESLVKIEATADAPTPYESALRTLDERARKQREAMARAGEALLRGTPVAATEEESK